MSPAIPQPETIFSLDTSSKFGSISISRGHEIISEFNFISNDRLSSILIPGIEFALKTVNLNLNDIHIFGVGIGPGSFTGIRVGLATLKGLLFGKNKPIVPVLSLEALAYKTCQTQGLLIPIIDAKRNEIYMGGYRLSSDYIVEDMAPDLIQIEEITEKIKKQPDLCFIGDGVNSHYEYLKKKFKNSKFIHRSSFLASEICQIAYLRYLNKQVVTDIQTIKPFYIRKPDAEKALKQKNKDKKSQSG